MAWCGESGKTFARGGNGFLTGGKRAFLCVVHRTSPNSGFGFFCHCRFWGDYEQRPDCTLWTSAPTTDKASDPPPPTLPSITSSMARPRCDGRRNQGLTGNSRRLDSSAKLIAAVGAAKHRSNLSFMGLTDESAVKPGCIYEKSKGFKLN